MARRNALDGLRAGVRQSRTTPTLRKTTEHLESKNRRPSASLVSENKELIVIKLADGEK